MIQHYALGRVVNLIVAKDIADMNCPNCSCVSLSKVNEENQGYNCSQCSGLWLSGENLIFMGLEQNLDIGILKAQLRQNKGRDGQRSCPNCEKSLLISTIDEIELDWCASCDGMWFDRDELDGIVANARKISTADKILDTLSVVGFLSSIVRKLT